MATVTQGLTSAAEANLRKKVKALLASTADLTHDVLSSASTDVTAGTQLQARFEEHVKAAEKCVTLREAVDAGTAQEGKIEFADMDMEGTRLWNLAAVMARESCGDDSGESATVEVRKKVLLQVRILACYMLETAGSPDTRRMANTMRLFKIAVKASRLCIDLDELRWAEKIIGRAAKYQGEISKMEKVRGEEAQVTQILCDYFMLRTTLAWKQSSLTIADYMFNKAIESNQYLADPRLTERMAESVLEIGKDLFINRSYPAAEKWLQRAFELINKIDPTYLTESGTELRMVISHKLARCCIEIATPECFARAHNLVDMMIDDWPSRISVFLLKLDLVVAESPDNANTYADVLTSMIMVAQLSVTTFKVILGRMHALLKISPERACECLDTLMSKRLLLADKQEWLEQCFVTRLWFIIQSQAYEMEENQVLARLKELLDTMARQLKKQLSAKATHAAQILLWKVSDILYSKQKYGSAGSWCRVALHMVFDKSGDLNHAKIARRIIQCCILTKDYGTAAEVFNSMPLTARDAPLSRFLMYKIALRTTDDDLASSCLQSICENVSTDRRLLYACALDAQDVGNRRLALKTLYMIAVKTEKFPEDAVHVPSLLRCTIRLIVAEIEVVRDNSILLEDLCQIYEKVVFHATRSRQKNRITGRKDDVFDAAELAWFSRNGYNLGLRSIIEWPHQQSLRIWTSCGALLAICIEDVSSTERTETLYRQMLCDFLCASLSIELARLEDSVEIQLQHYLKARNYISSFRSRLPEIQGRPEPEMADIHHRFTVLLGYDFEAAVRLKAWNDLDGLVDEATAIDIDPNLNSTVTEVMAHMILSSDAQVKLIFTILRKVLDKMITTGRKRLENIARLIRSVVQLALLKDWNFAAEILSQAVELARNSGPGDTYPGEEIEWLVATTWNKSIDFTCAADTENEKKFRALALALAGVLKDKSMLRYLQRKMLEDSSQAVP